MREYDLFNGYISKFKQEKYSFNLFENEPFIITERFIYNGRIGLSTINLTTRLHIGGNVNNVIQNNWNN